MVRKKNEKPQIKYECELCNFNTLHKGLWNRHISTPKHLMVINGNKKEQINNVLYNCECGKEYKNRSALSRHKKSCNQKESNYKELLNEAMRENRELVNKIVELAKEPKTVNNNTINNTTNNMTINVFLNEKCKDAMNLVDFVKSLNITWEDTAKTKDICIEQSLTNLIMDRVKDMDITERPIHCTDKKRLQYYVKDGEWKNKDIDIVFDKVLYDISNRHRQNLLDYCDQYPEWMKADENTAMYFGISECSLLFKREMPDRINKIKKLLSDKVLLKKEDIK